MSGENKPGADMPGGNGAAGPDVVALMAEITAEVRRKQQAGLYPPEILVEMDLDDTGGAHGDPKREAPVRRALANLQQSSRFTAMVTSASSKPVVGPLVAKAKGAMRRSLTWYINGILQQVTRFANATVSTTSLLADRTADLEERLRALEAERDERRDAGRVG